MRKVEFKIRMTKEEAEKVLDKVFDRGFCYTTKIKTDKYWSSSDGKTKEEGKVLRIRSEHYVTDKEIAYFSEKGDVDIKNWFFYETEKMFAESEVKKWEDKVSGNLLDSNMFIYEQKKNEDGVENYEKFEEPINMHSQLIILNKIFDNIGKRYFSKNKRCLSMGIYPGIYPNKPYKSICKSCKEYHCGNCGITIDISNVKDKFYFEIEGVVASDDANANNVIKNIIEEIVSRYGLDPNKNDSRSWVEIINEG